jgi:hypothetical protein
LRHYITSLALIVGLSAVAEELDFNRDVKPVLSNYCWACHGPDEQNREAKLRLDKHDGLLKDRDGVTPMVPGKPDKSELFARMISDDPDEVMPPPKSKQRPSKAEIEIIRQWIADGGKWEEHWAFVTPKRPKPPETKTKDWATSPIDHFVLRRVERAKLEPGKLADKRTLIRRVSLHLTGLPPTPTEVQAFLDDKSPDAYAKVVDRLLASERYGEHMAVTWLENSRYADTDGYQNDRYRYHWAWRDWVIKAYNANMPFDVFVTKQLAGDMLPDATRTDQIATGFGRNHRINSEAGSIAAEWHAEYVADRVETLGTLFLGLTMTCSRCHDHKYDPVSQKEFYQLAAYFNNVPEHGVGPNNGNTPPFIPVPKSWPNPSDAENTFVVPEPVKLRPNQGFPGFERPQPGKEGTVMVMHEMKEPRPTYVLQRGLYDQPDKSEVLKPGVPQSVDKVGGDFPPNRIGLAQWLLDPSHPLTARVTVNRIWQHFFGIGIVKTSENFGVQGEPPSHRQLLDWLAREFVDGGWDLKALQKTIVMSTTYRQASVASKKAIAKDPDNRLLSRGPRYRMSSFMLRDQALSTSGLLVNKMYGKPVKPYMPPKIWKSISNNAYKQDKGEKLYRRSLYTYWRRTIPPPTMMTFNSANREFCSVREERTNTPLQALTMMNNVTFVESARLIAERMLRDGGTSATDQLEFLYEHLLCRPPTKLELQRLAADYAAYAADFKGRPEATKELLKVGERKHDATLDPVQLAAATLVASTVLNLDETMTLE